MRSAAACSSRVGKKEVSTEGFFFIPVVVDVLKAHADRHCSYCRLLSLLLFRLSHNIVVQITILLV
jgi:hypothetical protein